jgi:hypothetical protein
MKKDETNGVDVTGGIICQPVGKANYLSMKMHDSPSGALIIESPATIDGGRAS